MKYAKDDDNYAFVMRNGVHLKSLYKRIMNLEASKYMTLHQTASGTYEIIAPCDVHLDNNNVGKAIGMGSIIIEAIVKGKIKR